MIFFKKRKNLKMAHHIEIQTKFRTFCQQGSLVDIEDLINHGDNVQLDIQRGFEIACCYGHLEIAKYLIYCGNNGDWGAINIHADDEYAFRCASFYGHLHILKYLIECEKEK